MNDKISNEYNRLKAMHPDAVLLFRIGDFYESYSNDALAISDVLGVTLTLRHVNGVTSQLAGFPAHALDLYLPRLVRAGKRVAICEMDFFESNNLCKHCRFFLGWCNRLVAICGQGTNDRVASDYLKDNKCEYFEQGESEHSTKPNFTNS